LYMSVLPPNDKVKDYMNARVESALRQLIITKFKQRGQSPARLPAPEVAASQMEKNHLG
jgi:hypothetical protein